MFTYISLLILSSISTSSSLCYSLCPHSLPPYLSPSLYTKSPATPLPLSPISISLSTFHPFSLTLSSYLSPQFPPFTLLLYLSLHPPSLWPPCLSISPSFSPHHPHLLTIYPSPPHNYLYIPSTSLSISLILPHSPLSSTYVPLCLPIYMYIPPALSLMQEHHKTQFTKRVNPFTKGVISSKCGLGYIRIILCFPCNWLNLVFFWVVGDIWEAFLSKNNWTIWSTIHGSGEIPLLYLLIF